MIEKGNDMKVGSLVKCYDFPGNTDCYMIGTLEKIEMGTLMVLKTIAVVFDGKVMDATKEPTFRAPIQGCAFGDDRFQRVINLTV